MSTIFANIDCDSHLSVVAIDPATTRHDIIAELGVVDSRRDATSKLADAGYATRGDWRTNTEGEDIRTVTRGPGRPEVGGAVHVRLGGLLSRVDEWASHHGTTRADAVRQLVKEGLDR